MQAYTPYHSQYLAHRLTLEGVGDEAFARSLSTARVEMKPHQVDAALFALKSPLSKGAILADEVGLGKTIEAGLVIAQRWAEQRRLPPEAMDPGAAIEILDRQRNPGKQELPRTAEGGRAQAVRACEQGRGHLLRIRGPAGG